MVAAYVGTLSWQLIWHGLLPPPYGSRNNWLALLAGLPLLIPLAGLVKKKYRSLIWAGLLLVLYLTIGIMEAWSNPAQRAPALVQIALAVFYLLAFRKRNQSQ
jgi:uncharacterized membrane protein